MYVNERSGYDVLSDPYQGDFGSFADPADDSRVSMDDGGVVGSTDVGSLLSAAIAAAGTTPVLLGGRLFNCLSGGGDQAECIWQAFKGIILASPQAVTILEYIRTADCVTVLTALGLDSSTVSLPCMLGGGVWSAFQAKVAAELGGLTGSTPLSRREQYEADYGRGRDRTDAEGGGHTLVNAEGNERNVWCPGYVRSIRRDAAGNVSAYVLENPKLYASGTRCPQDAPGTVRREESTSKKSGSMFAPFRPAGDAKQALVLTTKSGDGDGEPSSARPWYKSKWLWIGVGVVAVAGAVGVVVTRRTRRG